MKKIRFGLLSHVVLAIVLGVALGSFVPAPFVRGVNTVSAIIGQFIWQKVSPPRWARDENATSLARAPII